ncbi:MAG: type II secretion system protein [Armatimonadota bacterium]|nr:type II secretion system protein [Armatimonadota bacterium]
MKRIDQQHGFSLLELLTVVAIIAILAAVLFPIFRAAKERAKKTACVTNMHAIGVALSEYKLDNNRYPTCLLGYYTVDQPIESCTSSLYPEYVKSIGDFTCPSQGAGDINSLQSVTVMDANGGKATADYYFGDSYDWTDPTGMGDKVATYMRMWAPPGTDGVMNPGFVGATFAPNTDPDDATKQTNDYMRQLRFKDPDATTVVTWCMNHRGGDDKAQVLFLSGNVVAVPMKKMTPSSGTITGEINVLYRALPK